MIATYRFHSTKRFWFTLLLWVVLVAVRYPLTAHLGDTYLIHNAIADSILQGNKWGLHALVKLLDIPLVPTLGLVLGKLLALPLGVNAVALLTAISQATLVILLLRAVPRKTSFSSYALVAVAALPAVPLFRTLICTNDPNWISTLPFAMALLHLEAYRQRAQFSSLVGLAVHLGLLVFCGPTLLVCAIVLLCGLTASLNEQAIPGIRFVLWLPFVYALLLWLPWGIASQENGLIDFFTHLSHAPHHLFRCPFPWHPFCVCAVTSLILALKTQDNLTARCLLPIFFVIPVIALLSTAAQIALPAAEGTFVVAVSILILNAFNQPDEQFSTPQLAALLSLVLLFVTGFRHSQVAFAHKSMPAIILREAYRPQPPPMDLFDSRDAPAPQMLIDLADRQWKGSRIIVPGQRMAEKVYPEPSQTHFRPLPDFTPRAFKQLARQEQFHLIVPPDDGRFYGSKSHLARIHARGAAYLMLIAQLDNGWQLWRALPPDEWLRQQPAPPPALD